MTKKQTFKIQGRVIDSATSEGLAGLRVEAWDKDLFFSDLVGSAVTDEQGSFQIEFDQSYFRELFLDRQPDLFFKVFRGGNCIHSTENSVLWNASASTTDVVIKCDSDGNLPAVMYRVRGKVTFADGFPAAGGAVSAFERDLRAEQILGKSRASHDGTYLIQYEPQQFQAGEAGSADLIIKAYSDNGSVLAI